MPRVRRAEDGGRGGRRLKAASGADRQDSAVVSALAEVVGHCARTACTDSALFRALQGSRARQVGQGHRMARAGIRAEGYRRRRRRVPESFFYAGGVTTSSRRAREAMTLSPRPPNTNAMAVSFHQVISSPSNHTARLIATIG